ncbi:hypothetical protein A3H22_01625 [Candidatus Peribacteria bacterium RIFCSPLOWO2_12_FULL_55_15]|nr:MAG: hypothetical protein A2789_02240 [Candidatus Peribacteria bacterium RIFCSPHIGHO2_01_FULL_54_22]OGJ62636.1 MAG: hypothetical protein A3D12_03670 [Candidatus Peribacteria bacterium RIFCSPHIGHO2_02_FULL_55_24]OGJ65360.1 MAG: hypothetical protein A3E47_02415 [Candidatus Peribacteria bacterium RIFCSPHIGHO2_12_FULL_54_10]OGJ67954.1 MAG: hypothetical protein A2947_02460 [Candidatus Peribacteria bacterium RIFCSPLOWO2_01_FULL_54_110]OGJ70279.1 MAG: hypothetical protein A3H90_03455 [Candidatus Pe
MAYQRNPHERDVELTAVERRFVGYFDVRNQQIGTVPAHERQAQLPIGTVYEQEYILYQDICLDDGFPFSSEQCLIDENWKPKTFLCGRVATDQDVVMLFPMLFIEKPRWRHSSLVVAMSIVVVKQTNGANVGIPLMANDIAPPEGASPYAVGESPEERMAAMVQDVLEEDICPPYDCELEQIRKDAKNGIFDEVDVEVAE